MKRGTRMMFRPKPIMLFDNPCEEGRTFIIFKPCGYCHERFHCIDVTVTSCKHTFHPFCLGVMLKHSNKCCICNVKFHPDQWTSWGFVEFDEDLVELANQMKLAKARDDKMLKVKETITTKQYLSPISACHSPWLVLSSKMVVVCF